mmetsp:Transcript_1776/g.3853  ORF Transcript_1776/g.3853 Transcript_1776/m.3853 type:complete len:227 (-) Transcript_1776:662-1342(-)
MTITTILVARYFPHHVCREELIHRCTSVADIVANVLPIHCLLGVAGIVETLVAYLQHAALTGGHVRGFLCSTAEEVGIKEEQTLEGEKSGMPHVGLSVCLLSSSGAIELSVKAGQRKLNEAVRACKCRMQLRFFIRDVAVDSASDGLDVYSVAKRSARSTHDLQKARLGGGRLQGAFRLLLCLLPSERAKHPRLQHHGGANRIVREAEAVAVEDEEAVLHNRHLNF